MTDKAMTIGELKDQLEGLNDSDRIHLPGNLTFYRIKYRGGNDCYIEVDEPFAYLSDEFKKGNPHVKVAFIRTDNVEWDEDGIVGGPIDVEVR